MTDILKCASIVKDRAEIKLRAAEAIVPHNVFESSNLSIPEHEMCTGKAHDVYFGADDVVLVNTDKVVVDNEHVFAIPFKGATANCISMYWFNKTKDMIPNHVLSMPHPNVMVAKKCKVFPVKLLMLGFLMDVAHCHLWSEYEEKNARTGNDKIEPDHMRKFQMLPKPHMMTFCANEQVTKEDILASEYMTTEEYDKCASYAMKLYEFGYQHSMEKRMILASAVYEFGKDLDGLVRVVGDLHSPESADYWIEETYEQCLRNNKAPDSLDCEYLMEWCSEHEYGSETVPPSEIVEETAVRLLSLYEMITDEELRLENLLHERTSMERAIARVLTPIH